MEQPDTKTEDRPNLFSYATSELSQDAFICWLAAWADPKYKASDANLHEIGQQFVLSMIHKEKPSYTQSMLKTVSIGRQVGKLDVLIEVNERLPDKLAILVEDKTHTSNHHDQLNRYYDQVSQKYGVDEMIPLYFKTGYQSRFDTLGVFKPYLRKDFLSVLRGNKDNTNNAIFHDFQDHLESLESAIQQFSTKKLEGWDRNDWQGLFMVLYETFGKEDNKADWGYVPNASGGFFGFWWDFWGPATGDYWSYLQWEYNKLCYKIGFSDEIYKADDWKTKAQKFKSVWSDTLLNLDSTLTSENTRIGKTMTVAKLVQPLPTKEDGTLDLDQTIATMIKAQEVLKEARQKLAYF